MVLDQKPRDYREMHEKNDGEREGEGGEIERREFGSANHHS